MLHIQYYIQYPDAEWLVLFVLHCCLLEVSISTIFKNISFDWLRQFGTLHHHVDLDN